MSSQPSGLGRYDESDAREALHTVRLVGVPVRVLEAGRRHHDELMHEFAVLAVAEELADDLPQRMIDLIDTLGRTYGQVSQQPYADMDAALARGDDTIDLTFEVAAHVVDAANMLEQLMTDADEFCRREQMLTLQRSDVVRTFSSWYLNEFRRQVAGEPPRRWDGPLDP